MSPVVTNRRRKLVLSIDYEVFGNGSGDVRQHVVAPTERMARLAERHGMPLSIFVEVEEYLAFERHARELRASLGYDPAQLIRDQISSLVRRGHDVQLHLHPQWFGATWAHCRWHLNEKRQTVDSLFESTAEAVSYIADRKAALQDMAGSVSGGRFVAYRAGAFSAQPGRKLIAALAANGFVLDSSVVRGLVHEEPYCSYDYRNAPSARDPWRVSVDVAQADPTGPLWEVPIYSVMGRRLQQATWGRLRAKFSRNVPKAQQKAMVRQLGVGKSPLQAVKFLCQPVPIKLDFHNLSPRALLRCIKSAPPPTDGLPDVLVAIGHTKEHINDHAFERFLALMAEDPELQVVSLREIAGMLTGLSAKASPEVACK
jgi:hypothetical protein